jgi:hypothetical protein
MLLRSVARDKPSSDPKSAPTGCVHDQSDLFDAGVAVLCSPPLCGQQ